MSTKRGPVTDLPVCVTGASGYIASYIIQDLLAAGYRVRGTVRNPAKREGYQHLLDMPGAAERLEIVAGELHDAAALNRAVAGCSHVLHTASPYALNVEDPQRDLVEPAVTGTRHVLSACAAAGTVRRVVLTSSMAAITDEPDERHVLTEQDWNEHSSLTRNPYYYSKTMAERAAWSFLKEQSPPFDLVVINPFLVIGPSLTQALNPSNQLFVDVLAGTYPGILSIAWGFVDVRDVARAHVLALQNPSAAGRYLCAHETMSMRDLVALLGKLGYDKHRLPKLGLDCAIGDFAIKLGSYLQPKGLGSYLRTHVGRTPRFDNSKIRQDLGLAFRPLEESIKDTLADLNRWGHIKQP